MSGSAERLLAAAALALAASGARADVFSPGPLSAPHAKLEGLTNCTKCHVAGSRLSNDTCLACHEEVKDRIGKKRGFHGHIAPAELSCNKCHHDHQGRDFKLVDWGAKGEEGFDHARTGFALKGKHAQVACDKCHDERLIADAAVRSLKEKTGRRTFLGAPSQCSSCHFDEHRGQLGTSCARCHVESSWKRAPGFSHAKTGFPLLGKHARVDCGKCHESREDNKAHKGALSATFAVYKPVEHASCTDCHQDPHRGKLGGSCSSCHVEDDWKELKGGSGARAFHEKTRYPLRGAHASVACKSCHGPFPGIKAAFKGLRFQACGDCHVDAHVGQLGTPPPSCDRCHSLQSFQPADYEPAMHKTFPLQGGHAAVSCAACHLPEPALLARASLLKAFIEKRGRKDVISLTNFHPSGDPLRCDGCHSDPHRGQFAGRVKQAGCADCHQVSSFIALRFDHARESSFLLTGAHQRTACGACHFADAAGIVRYKPLTAECAGCHADPHAGQFTGTSCETCHTTAAWKELEFAHRPPFTFYQLEGKHASVRCQSCHREVEVGGGARAFKYRGVPTTCAGCHVDVHRGVFPGVAR
ncbi:MAG TPA: cytochrome c3 family protein [Myxococcales bacterium]|nr:cytochrome c3 family protein [Myxococcales bacterium]